MSISTGRWGVYMIKILYQIGLIFAICWTAQIIEHLLPIAFPASIIALILLFCLLASGVVKIEHIREKSDFLLSNMAFFFIPASVNIINYLPLLKKSIIPIVLISVFTTILTFIAASSAVRLAIRLCSRKKRNAGSI